LKITRGNGSEAPPPLPETHREALPATVMNGDEASAPSTEIPQDEQTLPTVVANLYVFTRDQVEGPFSVGQLQALLQANTINSATPCCEGGAESWKTVADYVDAGIPPIVCGK